MKEEVDGLLKKPMDRKGFLKSVGIGAVAVLGVATVAKTIDIMADNEKKPGNEAIFDEEVEKAGAAIEPGNKIIRTICYFTDSPSDRVVERLETLTKKLESKGYAIQTKRICSED